MRDRKRISNVFLMSIVFMLFTACVPRLVWAGVELKAVPGLGGLYKQGSPVEIKITVANNGPAIKGAIQVIARDANNRPVKHLAIYRRELEIPSQTNFNTTMLIPGELASNDPKLELWVDDKLLAYSKLQGTVVNNGGAVILALGEKIFQGGFVSWAEKVYGSNVTVKYLPLRDLPQSYFSLLGADAIVMDQTSAALLEQGQAKMIEEWVKLGGCLILSGVKPGGVEYFSENIYSEANNKLLVNGKKVLLAKQNIGRGAVFCSELALGSVPVDNKQFWDKFVRQLTRSKGNVVDSMRYKEEFLRGGSLVHASSYLPQLKFPSIPGLAVFWGIYLLVVGPLTYIVLKRLDRRDWAWWVIPACAAIAAIGVFFTSPSQKLVAPFGQTLAVVDILDERLAEVRGAGSFVTVKGGAVKVDAPPEAVVTPVNYYRVRSDTPVVVDLKQEAQEVSFQDVEYWSMRQSSLYTLWKDFGQIKGNLCLEDDRVVGILKNNTEMDLRDCGIQVAGRLIDIGKLPAGEEKYVDEQLDKWPLVNRWGGMRNRYGFSHLPDDEGEFIREERMLNDLPVATRVIDSSANTWGESELTRIEFMGWSDRDTSMFKIHKLKDPAQQTDLTLVRQFLQLELPTGGEVVLPPGFIPVRVIDGGFIEQDGVVMIKSYKGQVTFEYDLSGLFAARKFNLDTVDISGLPKLAQQYNVQVFNWKDDVWEALPLDKKPLSGDTLTGYLSPDNKVLRIKILNRAQEPGSTILPPALVVKGVMQ